MKFVEPPDRMVFAPFTREHVALARSAGYEVKVADPAVPRSAPRTADPETSST